VASERSWPHMFCFLRRDQRQRGAPEDRSLACMPGACDRMQLPFVWSLVCMPSCRPRPGLPTAVSLSVHCCLSARMQCRCAPCNHARTRVNLQVFACMHAACATRTKATATMLSLKTQHCLSVRFITSCG
jgi:hypothetical protein